jgi:hypothetical protein
MQSGRDFTVSHSSFGLEEITYTVDEGTKTIHVNSETSTFPNLLWAPNQRRIVTSISAEEMKFTNPRTPAGLTLVDFALDA